ncbi:MAG TPA: uracil-DNA glycosylase [Ignavibacteriales bacterium]|nr:uracil-DNA glycosylase [Ignavibacteriales bacterium]HRT99655.1 uracil-DNA glycosylase [Ignavibacteriales bacterium]
MNKIITQIIETLLFQKDLTGDNLYIPKDEIIKYFTKIHQIQIEKPQEIHNKIENSEIAIKVTSLSEIKTIEKEYQKELPDTAQKVVKSVSIPKLNILTSALENKDYENIKSLDEFNKAICNCKKCQLGNTRTNFVFGEGNPNADIMVIGEGPGAEEDAQGRPFVGKAGQLLDKILESIKFKREDVYIANVVKCRPPGNRVPQDEEVAQCLPYLIKQIKLVNPKMILCVGLTAASYLLPKKNTLQQYRGQFWDFMDKKLLVTYHPAALLRNPNLKKDTWEDVKLFRKYYDNNILKQKSIFE